MSELEIIKGKVARSLDQHGVAILTWYEAEWLIKQVEELQSKLEDKEV